MSGRWTASCWGRSGTACRNVSIADAALAATVLSVALRLLCMCLWLLPALFASSLGKSRDRCQQ